MSEPARRSSGRLQEALAGSRGTKRLPIVSDGSLAGAIGSGRSTRARRVVQTPSSTAYAELHRQGYTILKAAASRQECAQLLASATREDYKEILGDKLRLHAPNATSAPLATRIIERALAPTGIMMCSDGSTKSATDVAPLKSLLCVASGTPAAEAAIVGRQKAHHDPSNLEPDELARFGLKPLSELPDMDQPVSAMLAVQEGTSLWIFPGGCDPAAADAAFLLPDVDVGDAIVWRGAHAGKGYAEEHYRWHGYVDPPPHIYRLGALTGRAMPAAPTTRHVCWRSCVPIAAGEVAIFAMQTLRRILRLRRATMRATTIRQMRAHVPRRSPCRRSGWASGPHPRAAL